MRLEQKAKAFYSLTGITHRLEFGNVTDLKILRNQSPSFACKWLGRYRTISSESLNLLLKMGGNYVDPKVAFPGSLYNMIDNAKAEDKVKFLAVTLDQISHLMDASEHMTATHWNLNTVELFLNLLHRQSSELKECVAHYQMSSHKKSYERRIERHFKIVKKILKKEEYSAPAWEQIRRAVRSHLQRMDILANNTKSFPGA